MRTPSPVSLASRTLLVLSLPLALPCADVLVVDAANGPGTDFTSISGAVASARQGDVLLVRDGQYGFVSVSAKTLVIQAEEGANPFVTTGVVIADLAANQSVTLRGIDVGASQLAPSLAVTNCQGPVWVEDAELSGSVGLAFPGGGVDVQSCASVLVSRSTVHSFESQFLAPGLRVTDSTVTLHASTIHGPKGFDQAALSGNPGGVGVEVVRGVLTASDSVIVGGAGGDFIGTLTCHDGGAGGPGLRLGDQGSALAHGTQLLGGPGGSTVSPCATGATGPALVQSETSLFESFAEGLGQAVMSSPVREGGIYTLDLSGEPGAYAWVLYGPAQAPASFASLFLGARHVSNTGAQIVRAGLLPAGGTLHFELTAGQLPLGVESRLFYEQILTYSFTDRRLRLGGGTVLTVLDDSF